MSHDKYYEITKNLDETEGRGSIETTGIFFWKKSDALAFVKSHRYHKFGIMGTCGSDYDIREKSNKLPRIYDSLEEYDKVNPNKEELKRIKRQALAKLTDMERMALEIADDA